MKSRGLYIPLLFLFFIFITLKPALAPVNYVDLNLNLLPIAESKDYYVFATFLSGSGTYDYWRIYIFDKNTKNITRIYDFSTNTIQTSTRTYNFSAYFITPTRILLCLNLYKGYYSGSSTSMYHYLFVYIYDITTNTILASSSNARNLNPGLTHQWCFTAKIAHTSKIVRYGNEFWLYYSAGGYCESSSTYYSACHASVAKIILNENLNAISSITRYDYAGLRQNVQTNNERALRRGEIYAIDDNYLLLIAHTPSDFTKYIEYRLITRSTGEFTFIATHPFEDDFDFVSSTSANTAFYTSYMDTYIILNYYATKQQSDGGTKIVFHKLVFNNTLTNFVAQYRNAGVYYGSLSTKIWHIFVSPSKTQVRLIIPNSISGQKVITMFKISISETDTPFTGVSLSTNVVHNPAGWDVFTYRSPSASVLKIKPDDVWVVELYNSVRLYFGLPAFYLNINVEMLEQTQVWWEKDTIAKDLTYPIYIKVTSNGINVQNALVELYDNYTGVLEKRAQAYTGANGVAALAFSYGLTLEAEYITIQIVVSYAGDVITVFTKTFKVTVPKFNIYLIVVEAKEYDPNKVDYNFSEPVPTSLVKNVNYIFIFKVLREEQNLPNAQLLLKFYKDDKRTLDYSTILTTDYYGLAKISFVTSYDMVILEADLYYANMKVGEAEWTFTFTSIPLFGSPYEEFKPIPTIITQVGIGSILSVLPALIIILVPAFAFYSVMKNGMGLMIGLNCGLIIASLSGLIPFYMLFLIILLDVLYFMREVQR